MLTEVEIHEAQRRVRELEAVRAGMAKRAQLVNSADREAILAQYNAARNHAAHILNRGRTLYLLE